MFLFLFLGHYVHQCRAYSYSSIPPLVLSVVSYKEPQQFRHHTQCVNNFASIFQLLIPSLPPSPHLIQDTIHVTPFLPAKKVLFVSNIQPVMNSFVLKKDSFHFRRRHRVNLGGANFQGNLEDVQTFSPDRISYTLLMSTSQNGLLA